MTPERIAAPTPPTPPPPYGFPMMATIAPVVVSLALWLLTGSVFALVFATLGPAVAIASLADARLQSRRRTRRERRRFSSELAAARREIAAAHDRERDWLEHSLPSARRLAAETWNGSEQWLAALGEPVAVCVGAGDRASSLTVDGLPAATRARDPHTLELRRLADEARAIERAPLVVDSRLGIGVVGPPIVAESVGRALVVQIAALLSPLAHSVVVEGRSEHARHWAWIETLPHAVRFVPQSASENVVVRFERIGGGSAGARVESAARFERSGLESTGGPESTGNFDSASVAVASRAEDLPRTARIVVLAPGASGRIERHPDPACRGDVLLEHVSGEQARQIAATLAAQAQRGRLVGSATLPVELAFADRPVVDPGPDGTAATGLESIVAVTAHGPLVLDLVAHGPHAVVGGTTGSGKSELLTAWILAMAHTHSPRVVNVLLVDFKGGSAFAGLAVLPHCVGMITDLDEAAASRALDSLAAELRRRERYLAAVGAKSIDALGREASPSLDPGGGLARLVIVVDEFAAMVAGFPELHALFADVAARGRSLGVHLILCTQRPAGVIRDAVLANSALRLSLRVNNRADSAAVIGTDAASALAVHPRGRVYVSADGQAPVLAQFALVSQGDIADVARRWQHEPYRAHRPWLEPLPGVITLEHIGSLEIPAGAASERSQGLPFGVVDDPGNQSQPVARYRPSADGNLLVIGGAGSGKSTLLDVLEAAADGAPVERMTVDRVPLDVERAWDALVTLAEHIRTSPPLAPTDQAPADQRAPDQRAPDQAPARPASPARLVLIDDLDVLVGRFPEEYESAVLELVVLVLREGPGRGIHAVITTQRLTAALHQVAALCGSRVILRLPNRQEHVLAGGDGADFVDRARPGAGRWHSLAVQVATLPPPGHQRRAREGRGAHRSDPATARVLDASRPLAIVTARPDDFVARLERALPEFGRHGAVVDVTDRQQSGVVVSSGPRPVALVGDLDAWQSQWGALQSVRSTHLVIVDGLGASDFRAVTRLRALPPPLSVGDGAFWLWGADGFVVRARLPKG